MCPIGGCSQAALGCAQPGIYVKMLGTFVMEIYENNRAIKFWKVLQIFVPLTLLYFKQNK